MRHDETGREDRDTDSELRPCGLREDERVEKRSARLSERSASPDDTVRDLPLKILIAEGADGITRISYNSLPYLQTCHELSAATIENVVGIKGIVEALVHQHPPGKSA